MTSHLAELATRWQRLAERQRDHLLSLRGKRRRYDDAELEVLISRAEHNMARWAALAGESKCGDEVEGASEEHPCEVPAPKFNPRHLPARLANDPQEAGISALESLADGQRSYRWPGFLHVQPQPCCLHTERFKG